MNSAITADTPIGNVGAIPDPSGAGVQPSGETSCMRFAADSQSAIGAGSISRPLAIIRLALTYPYESAPPIVVSRNRNHASTLPQIAVSSTRRVIHFG